MHFFFFSFYLWEMLTNALKDIGLEATFRNILLGE